MLAFRSAAVLALVVIVFATGYRTAAHRWQTIHDAARAEHRATLARLEADAVSAARAVEQRHAA